MANKNNIPLQMLDVQKFFSTIGAPDNMLILRYDLFHIAWHISLPYTWGWQPDGHTHLIICLLSADVTSNRIHEQLGIIF